MVPEAWAWEFPLPGSSPWWIEPRNSQLATRTQILDRTVRQRWIAFPALPPWSPHECTGPHP
jgi:hypothetical protein